MEGTAPDNIKRPRLDSYSGPPPSHRMQQQLPDAQLHTYSSNALPPPNTYHTPVPPSPYDGSAGEHRSLPEPAQHCYTQPHSGYNTPSRSYPPEASYSRHGSVSAPTRSPDDIQQLAQLRPLNTAPASDAHHYSQQHHPDSAGPSGYALHEGHTNGTPHGLSMPGPNESTHAPPHQGHIGGYITSPIHNASTPFSAGPYGSQIYASRPMKKNTRATQACDTCRARKARCDEGKPVCSFCRETDQICNYKEVAPAKADRAQKEIMDQLRDLREKMDHLGDLREKVDRLGDLREKMDGLQRTFNDFTSTGKRLLPAHSPARLADPELKYIPLHADTESPEAKPVPARRNSSRDNSRRNEPSAEDDEAGAQNIAGPAAETQSAPPLSVHTHHTTAAHRLLRWPSIKALLKGRPMSEDYVMEMEERKGLLRVYGRGQGRDTLDGGQPGPASPAMSSTSGKSDDTSRSPASPPQSLWGSGFGPPSHPDAKRLGHDHPGGLNIDGTLKVDRLTMMRLLDSYLNNIHIMHPFLDKGRLVRMFERFAARYNTADLSTTRSPFVPPTSALGSEIYRDSPTSFNKATKRKHSTGTSTGTSTDTNLAAMSGSIRTTANQGLERCVSTAIVLLVMALGKICEHTDPLPGPLPDNPRDILIAPPRSYSPSPSHVESPPPLSVKPSPVSSQASMHTSAPSPMSNMRPSTMSRRSSLDETVSPQVGHPHEKNADVIPGLAYFAHATDILGNLHGGNDLAHVQAHLLAGLYMGQLACTLESWNWIQTACRACHFLVRDPKLTREKDEARKDLIRFAYWTCLQLESDILAELDLRSSGIDRSEYDDLVDFPKGVTENNDQLLLLFDRPESKVMAYYSFQIGLRNILNTIQKELYPPSKDGRIAELSLQKRDELDGMLASWRSFLPEPMQWRDGESPSTDINEARLRAKYYGAMYIVHRPFLYYALHSQQSSLPGSAEVSPIIQSGSSKYLARNADRQRGSMAPPRSALSDLNQNEVWTSARLCCQAAMYSTEAFDGVCIRRRLVVTNIFGTAHAQFGNMLVLAATYRSHLRFLVDKKEVFRLLERTVLFLRRLRSISPTLDQDAKILEHVLQTVRGEEPSSSFSSTTS